MLTDSVFLVCAVLGGGVFVVRTLLQLLGVGADADLDLDADAGFRVLSLQGLSAFFMMFGLVGLALLRESKVGPTLSVVVATTAGLGSMWLIARAFSAMAKLQSSGTLKLSNAVGQDGTVYLSLVAGGRGKVELVVQGRLGIWEARAASGDAIPTGARVRVVAVEADEVLVVVPTETARALSA